MVVIYCIEPSWPVKFMITWLGNEHNDIIKLGNVFLFSSFIFYSGLNRPWVWLNLELSLKVIK